MAISGLLDIHYTIGMSTDPIVDFINTKFSDKLVATHEENINTGTKIHIKDTNNHEIMRLLTFYEGAATTATLYNHSGTIGTYNLSNGTKAHWSIYACTNGLLIRDVNESAAEMWIYITFNEDGTIIYGISPATTTGQSPTSFVTATWDLSEYTTTATSREAGCTSLANLIHNGGYGELSVAEYAYFALYNQYPHTIGILNLGDNLYISNGWFVIKD